MRVGFALLLALCCALEFEQEGGVGGDFEREGCGGGGLGGGLGGGGKQRGISFGEKDLWGLRRRKGKRDLFVRLVRKIEDDRDAFVVVCADCGKDLFFCAADKVDAAEIAASEGGMLVAQVDQLAVKREQGFGIFGL